MTWETIKTAKITKCMILLTDSADVVIGHARRSLSYRAAATILYSSLQPSMFVSLFSDLFIVFFFFSFLSFFIFYSQYVILVYYFTYNQIICQLKLRLSSFKLNHSLGSSL